MTQDEIRAAARAHCETGRTALKAGRCEDAEGHFRAAYDLYSALLGASPTLDDARELARATLLLGEALYEMRRFEDGRRYFGEAKEVWEGIVDETDALSDKRELACAVERLGSLGRDPRDPEGRLRLMEEVEMATHCSILAWRIPWTEEPGGLQSTGS